MAVTLVFAMVTVPATRVATPIEPLVASVMVKLSVVTFCVRPFMIRHIEENHVTQGREICPSISCMRVNVGAVESLGISYFPVQG